MLLLLIKLITAINGFVMEIVNCCACDVIYGPYGVVLINAALQMLGHRIIKQFIDTKTFQKYCIRNFLKIGK